MKKMMTALATILALSTPLVAQQKERDVNVQREYINPAIETYDNHPDGLTIETSYIRLTPIFDTCERQYQLDMQEIDWSANESCFFSFTEEYGSNNLFTQTWCAFTHDAARAEAWRDLQMCKANRGGAPNAWYWVRR